MNTWIQILVSFATTVLSSETYIWTIFMLTQTKYLLSKKKKRKKTLKNEKYDQNKPCLWSLAKSDCVCTHV